LASHTIKQLPTLEQPLDEPFNTILVAVFESGQVSETGEQEEEQI
jgi:hypothetical protein